MSERKDPDEALLARIRPLLKRRKGFTERRMFGGVCLLHGNLCVGTWNGRLIVRLDRENHDEIQAEPNVSPMDFTGKVMFGWALIEPAGTKTEAKLKAWIQRSIDYVSTLPQK